MDINTERRPVNVKPHLLQFTTAMMMMILNTVMVMMVKDTAMMMMILNMVKELYLTVSLTVKPLVIVCVSVVRNLVVLDRVFRSVVNGVLVLALIVAELRENTAMMMILNTVMMMMEKVTVMVTMMMDTDMKMNVKTASWPPKYEIVVYGVNGLNLVNATLLVALVSKLVPENVSVEPTLILSTLIVVEQQLDMMNLKNVKDLP
jgi:hypothetical protein